MEQIEAKRMYESIRGKSDPYNEEIHCPMVLYTVAKYCRITAFCKEANISERTFYTWTARYKTFNECYELAKVYAREDWEQEPEAEWTSIEFKAWASRGARYFGINKERVRIMVDAESNPYEQYKKIISDCASGDYTASEIKQMMESINVGRVAFESFKLQEEVDKMKNDLNQMSQRNGNNIIPISMAEK